MRRKPKRIRKVKPIRHYILDKDNNVVESTVLESFLFMMERNEGVTIRVANDTVGGWGDIEVSTVFLGHAIHFDPRPLCFETMIFSPKGPEKKMYHATWAEAVTHHNLIVKKLASKFN